MADAFEAIYERGVFRPLSPIGLEEGRKVLLSVQGRRRSSAEVAAHLEAWSAVFEGLSEDEIAEIEKIALDRTQFIPERDVERA